jgi:hypothetical protein
MRLMGVKIVELELIRWRFSRFVRRLALLDLAKALRLL